MAAGLVLLALVAGLAGTTWGLVRAAAAVARATRAEGDAVEQARLAGGERDKALAAAAAERSAKAAEADQRREAEAANQRARRALGSFTDDLMEKQLGSKATLTENETAILWNALAQWEVFAQLKGESVEGRAARAEGAFRVGRVQQKLGLNAEAEANYRRAVALQERLAADLPAVPDHRADLAASQNSLGFLLRGTGNLAGAEREYRAALALWDKLAADAPAVPWYRAGLADARHNLGDLLWQTGDRAGAAKEYRAALALREKLAADAPAVPDYQIALGNSYCHFGVRLHQSGHPADSLAWFDKAVRTLAPVYDRDRKKVTPRQCLRASHQGRATACDRLGKYADARADWDRAVDLCPAAEKVQVRAGRAASRVRAGATAEGVAEVADLARSAGCTAGQWYALAGVYAVASCQDAARRDEYAVRAVELLDKAVKAGYTDAAHMADDPDLAPLRGRADYRALAAGLEAKHPRRLEVAPPLRPVR